MGPANRKDGFASLGGMAVTLGVALPVTEEATPPVALTRAAIHASERTAGGVATGHDPGTGRRVTAVFASRVASP